MEQLNIDAYSVLAGILSLILSIAVPWLSYKYRKLLSIIRECHAFVDLIVLAWQDHSISEEEMKLILLKIRKLIKVALGVPDDLDSNDTSNPK